MKDQIEERSSQSVRNIIAKRKPEKFFFSLNMTNMTNNMTTIWPAPSWLVAQLVEHCIGIAWGHEFESRSKLNFFQAFFSQPLKFEEEVLFFRVIWLFVYTNVRKLLIVSSSFSNCMWFGRDSFKTRMYSWLAHATHRASLDTNHRCIQDLNTFSDEHFAVCFRLFPNRSNILLTYWQYFRVSHWWDISFTSFAEISPWRLLTRFISLCFSLGRIQQTVSLLAHSLPHHEMVL